MMAYDLLDASILPEAASCHIPEMGEGKESAGDYRAVAVVLNARWRIIECRNRLQWVLQHRDGTRHGKARWTGQSYCRTREGLKRACRAHAGEIDANARALLESMSDWIGGRS